MSEAPERIWAAPPTDDPRWESGAGEWDVSPHWAADGITEYVRADRIEELEKTLALRTGETDAKALIIKELEAKLAKAVDEVYNYDKAPTDPHHGGKLMPHQMQRRIEELEEELFETRMSELLALGQAQEAYEQQLAVETRLTKAVWLAEQECPFGYGTGSYNDWWHERRKTLAELTGGKDE